MYPFEGTKPPNTPMQEALLKKAGDQGHPFTFDVNLNLCVCLSIEKNNQGRPSFVSLPVLSQIPIHLPCSVSLQPAPEDAGKVQLQKYMKNTHKCNHRCQCLSNM